MNVEKSHFSVSQAKNNCDQNVQKMKLQKTEADNLMLAEKKSNTVPTTPKRVDKIEISNKTLLAKEFDVSKLKSKIVSEIKENTDIKKIQNIQQRIADGTYQIDANELANYILNL